MTLNHASADKVVDFLNAQSMRLSFVPYRGNRTFLIEGPARTVVEMLREVPHLDRIPEARPDLLEESTEPVPESSGHLNLRVVNAPDGTPLTPEVLRRLPGLVPDHEYSPHIQPQHN